MVSKGFFALMALILKDPTTYPNTMSSIPLESPLTALRIPMRSFKFLLILLSYVLAYVSIFLNSTPTDNPRPYYFYPICVAINFVVILLVHRRMRESISVSYKVVLVLNLLLAILTLSFWQDIEWLFIA